MKTFAVSLIAAALTAVAIPSAFAYDSDIRSDYHQVQKDRAQLRADEARLAQERREAARADAREHEALREGRFLSALRAHKEEKHERAEVRELERKVARDRGALERDSADLRRDIARY